METFRSVTPVVEPLSLDEAFLDVSGAVRAMGSPATIGQHIRDTVHDEQGITCSVGVASTKFVAKIASGLAKPDGMVVVPRDEVVPFVQQLPVGALWGVGERTEDALLRLGLRTVADIAHTPLATLVRGLVWLALGSYLFYAIISNVAQPKLIQWIAIGLLVLGALLSAYSILLNRQQAAKQAKLAANDSAGGAGAL